MKTQLSNYAPFGCGDSSNQFWAHIGNYSFPGPTLDSILRRLNDGHWHWASATVRDRSGRLVATKQIGQSAKPF
jgi:hypothetical protein